MSADAQDSIRCACVQFDVRRGDVQANLTQAELHLRSAAEAGVQLAVLPEMWTTSFGDLGPSILQEAQDAESRLEQLTAELDMLVVGSSPQQRDDGIHNVARVVDAGTCLGEYSKIHLFSPNSEHKHHAAGSEPLVIDTRLGRIAVAICYDLRFPELTRHFFEREATLLVVPAQWPEARSNHWRVLLKARAIENQMFVLGCNRNGTEQSMRNDDELTFPGDSRIVDPMGNAIASGAGESGPVIASLELRRVRVMRRIMPVAKDRRPDVYRRLRD